MLVDNSTYVPILRRRTAEASAVINVLNEDMGNIIPLFELCEHILPAKTAAKVLKRDPYEYLYEVLTELATCCGYRQFFIEFGYVESFFSNNPTRKHVIDVFYDLVEFQCADVSPIPVLGIGRSPEYLAAIARTVTRFGQEVCLRLTQADLRKPTFRLEIRMLLAKLDLTPAQVHLLVDLKETRDSNPTYAEVCSRLPDLTEWKSLIIAGGSFPKDLSGPTFPKFSETELPRVEWQRWEDALYDSKIARTPSFSDYAIQFPKRPEPLNFAPRTSASIRYTAERHFLVLRGQWLNDPSGAGYDQYWGLANALLQRQEYSGDDFSFADESIGRIGRQTIETGSIVSWLQIGLNRHLTLTARQVARAIESRLTGRPLDNRLKRYPFPKAWNAKRRILPPSYRQQKLFFV